MKKEIKFRRTSPGRYEARVGSLNYLIYRLEADQRSYLTNWSIQVVDEAKEGDECVLMHTYWNAKRDIMFFLKHEDWWLTENGYEL